MEKSRWFFGVIVGGFFPWSVVGHTPYFVTSVPVRFDKKLYFFGIR
jgi:hypothetical protein